jgi:hypothetical protein
MTKTWLRREALIPSAAFAAMHLLLSAIVGPQANVIFQRQFDTGTMPAGAEITVMTVNRLLSIPIPSLFFASHPARTQVIWWTLTAINSICWGAVLYSIYVLSARWLQRERMID